MNFLELHGYGGGKYDVGDYIDIFNITGTTKYVKAKTIYTFPATNSLNLRSSNKVTGYSYYVTDVSYSNKKIWIFDDKDTLLGSYTYGDCILLDDKSYILYKKSDSTIKNIEKYDYKGTKLWSYIYTSSTNGYLNDIQIQDNYIYLTIYNGSTYEYKRVNMSGVYVDDGRSNLYKQYYFDGSYYAVSSVYSSVTFKYTVTVDKYNTSMTKVGSKSFADISGYGASISCSLIRLPNVNLCLRISSNSTNIGYIIGIDPIAMVQLFNINRNIDNFDIINTPKNKNMLAIYEGMRNSTYIDTLTLYDLSGTQINSESAIFQKESWQVILPDLSFIQIDDFTAYKFERYLKIKG